MPTFEPPTYEAAIRTTVRPLNYYRTTESKSVVKVNGVFVALKVPSAEQLDGLTEGVDYFIGGHVYVVSAALASELEAAGFSTQPGYGETAYGNTPYGD